MSLLLLAVACTQEPPSETPDPTAPSAPPIDEALAERCPQPSSPAPSQGEALRRATLQGSAARCNDGSPPALYVRAATDPAHRDDWVLFLEGGSSCEDHRSCAERWCGVGDFDASFMSSRQAPESVPGRGVLSPAPANGLGGYNAVLLHYCSSDFWLGTRPAQLLEGDPPFVVRFEGDGILGAALDALSAGLGSDDGAQQLPSLEQAQTIVLGGSSAGGYGAMLQLHRVAQRLPQAKVIGAIDAALSLTPGAVSPEVDALMAQKVRSEWEEADTVWGAVVDARCAELTPEEERWRCFDIDHVLRSFVELPVAYHHDLYDPVLIDFFEEGDLDRSRFVEGALATLRGYAALPHVSVHGSACGVHMALVRTPEYGSMPVTDALQGGSPWTLHDLLLATVQGSQASAVDDALREGSVCP